jgi:SAM-dependent methyltransferase
MTGFEAEWRGRFERYARSSDDEAFISGWSALGLRRRFALFRSILDGLALPTVARVLDLGCGAGTYVRWLAGLGHATVGVDYSLPTLARALAADPGGKGRYVAAEGYALPFAPESFDLTVSIGVLQTLADPGRALDEVVRTLRPGGTVVLEALNARALAEGAARRLRRLRGAAERVRAYDPLEMPRWLEDRGLRAGTAIPVYLPPRRWPALARLFEARPVRARLEARPVFARRMAHAYLFVGRKP